MRRAGIAHMWSELLSGSLAALGISSASLTSRRRSYTRFPASRSVLASSDPKARFDGAKQQWRIDGGEYAVALARAADAPVERAAVKLEVRSFGR